MTKTGTDKDTFPLWQKILYGVLFIIVIGLLLWGADRIGLLGFAAGAGI